MYERERAKLWREKTVWRGSNKDSESFLVFFLRQMIHRIHQSTFKRQFSDAKNIIGKQLFGLFCFAEDLNAFFFKSIKCRLDDWSDWWKFEGKTRKKQSLLWENWEYLFLLLFFCGPATKTFEISLLKALFFFRDTIWFTLTLNLHVCITISLLLVKRTCRAFKANWLAAV